MNLYSYADNDPIGEIDPFGFFGIGYQVSGSAAIGIGKKASAAATVSGGAGLFLNQHDLFGGNEPSILPGFFASGGAFARTSNSVHSAVHDSARCDDKGPVAVGLYAGVGEGIFLTNAAKPADLAGPFKQTNFDFYLFSVSYATGTNANGEKIEVLSIGYGPGAPAAVSNYMTTTKVTP